MAEQTAADFAPRKENGSGRAVIGAEGGVLFDSTAEFAEAENNDAVIELGGLQIVQKGFERAGELAEERGVRVDLRGVRVVTEVAEDSFVAIVVDGSEVAKLVLADGPTGEGAGGFLHILLGVVADAKSEELHQLAGEIFIGMPLAVLRCIEPVEERWIVSQAGEQFPERSESQLAQRLVLSLHELEVIDFEVAGGEVVCHISERRS